MSLTDLAKKSLVVIFAYAPAGLGHLRVSDALYHGLPDSVTPVLLGAQDKSISVLYRFISIHPLTRWVMEFFQRGSAEYLFAFWYRKFLQSHTTLLYQQLVTVLEERIELPEVIVLVATHFGLAHQFVTIKEKLAKKTNIKVILIIQVTDDSPQVLWYIEGADVIFVPSKKTKEQLQLYGKEAGMQSVPLLVNPYPISPRLQAQLSPYYYHDRKSQCTPDLEHPIHIAVPISGAAVNTNYHQEIISALAKQSRRYVFHIISKNAPYTKKFLTNLIPIPTIKLSVSEQDRGVVSMYEDLYSKEIIGFEITKPSEQTFKALLSPRQRGGAILLFSDPVGRQEYDNLDFLRRHHLIPGLEQTKLLKHFCQENKPLLETEQGKALLLAAKGWRGVELPSKAKDAARFITYCLENNLFHAMLAYNQPKKEDNPEVQDDGVELFWKQVEQLLKNKDRS